MTNEYQNLYPVDGDCEELFCQVSPIFCDSGFNFWEPISEKYCLCVEIEKTVSYFETKFRNDLIHFLFMGEMDRELFSNN